MSSTRSELRFILNGTPQSVSGVGPTDTLLDWLRLDQRLTGTKEGCAEGDCGACTVLVGRRVDGGLRYETVNACIRLMPSVDLCHVVTIEHLRGRDGGLHPLQAAMVASHASQCGFCTPGIVMSLYALWMANPTPSVDDVEVALQGNLCRCTGYRPIIEAARSVVGGHDVLAPERDRVLAELAAMDTGQRVDLGGAILPRDLDDLAAVLDATPDATIVAGATDVGLWVTKGMRDIAPAVFLAHLPELHGISEADTDLTIGAGASYSDAAGAMARLDAGLADFWQRIGGWQVRNMGTIGGNIANGSPIGDTPPVLIALGAEITLHGPKGPRVMALEDYFIDYGKQDRRAGEFVRSIRIPRADAAAKTAYYKISKRRDEDISAVCAGMVLSVSDGMITSARIAFGGMAATPKRARHVEAALTGQPWRADSFSAAKTAMARDFTPLSDWRASADYRLRVAANLLDRFWLEHTGVPARLAREGAI